MSNKLEKKEIIINFNEIVKDLLNQVSPIIGSKYSIYFKNIIKFNSIAPIQNFILHAIPHKEKIEERNPEYFMNEDIYKSEVKKSNEFHKEDNTDEYLMEILNLKSIYLTIDDTSKENLWDIVNALLILSIDYVNI